MLPHSRSTNPSGESYRKLTMELRRPSRSAAACECMARQGIGRRRVLAHPALLCVLAVLTVTPVPVLSTLSADELADAVVQQQREDWLACLPLAEAAVKARPWNERAWHALIESQWRTGHAIEAVDTFREAFRRFPSSIRLRLAGREAMRRCGEAEEGDALAAPISEMVRQAPWRYTDAANQILLGKHYLELGGDARQVLEVFFDKAKKLAPASAAPFVATGQLALGKGDFQMAGEEFQQALKREEGNPHALYGLARAFLESDPQKGAEFLEQALTEQPRHLPSLLLLAERELDGELYEEAQATLDKVLAVNPDDPRAWALKSVIQTLLGNDEKAQLMRRIAKTWWPENPEVDHLIGRKLSRHYRFAEGAEMQRSVLKLDPNHVGATLQLSQDLLRLGEEEEGWRLANKTLEMDGYSVLAHNLMRLRKELDQFATIADEDFVVRMSAEESRVYGDRVLELLQAARETLCDKYRHELRTPVIVEIFPHQADFAVRTFGMPGGEGFLGVCFGSVITANSPASQGDSPSNWAAVLWHEFCHVVTLQKTNNRMPRWLSEGLSVYEERQRRRSWGQAMTPRYREMILGGELTPVSELSNAFLKPPSAIHLQFAYFESSLVVEFFIEQYGMESMLRVLDELGQGLPINASLARSAGSIEALDQAFEKYAKLRAEALAPEADWTPMPAEVAADRALRRQWLERHPKSLAAMNAEAQRLMQLGEMDEAIALLQKLAQWLPEAAGNGSPREALAKAYQRLGKTKQERAAWRQLLEVDSDNQAACLRLMELAAAEEDWVDACWAGERLCEINPLRTQLQRDLGHAAERAGQYETAVRAWQALAALGPADPVGVEFSLARSLVELGRMTAAKRHVLKALEEAPRYEAAQMLLLQIVDGTHAETKSTSKATSGPPLPPLESPAPPLDQLLPPLERQLPPLESQAPPLEILE